MKPLPRAALTAEDFKIAHRHAVSRADWSAALWMCAVQDRRDAELMLEVQHTVMLGINWNIVYGPCFAHRDGESIAVLGRPIWAPKL